MAEQVSIHNIETWSRNYNEGDIGAIAESIRRFGYARSIAVWNGTVMAGNHTLLALRSLHREGIDPPHNVTLDGGDWFISVADVSHLSEKEATAYAIADNRTAQLADTNDSLLAELLKEVANDDAELLLSTGYDADDLDMLIAQQVQPLEDTTAERIDEAEQLNEQWQVQKGDIYVINGQVRHKLMCGDSTLKENVDKLLEDATPYLMITDPPYGVNYDGNWRNDVLGDADRRTGKVTNDDIYDWREAYQLSPAKVAYVWHADRYVSNIQDGLAMTGFEVKAQIIWYKAKMVLGQGHYHWQHEPCWYAVKKGATAQWIGDRKQKTIWEFGLDDDIEGGHGTQKPLEAMARPIRNHAGDVHDPFGGSGTTMVASEQLNRSCYMMEFEPKYCAVILQRMTDLGCDVKKV